MRIIPNSAVKFLLYEQLSRSLSHRAIDAGGDGRLSPYSRLAAGAAATPFGSTATRTALARVLAGVVMVRYIHTPVGIQQRL